MMTIWKYAGVLLFALLFSSCYQTEERHRIGREELTDEKYVKVPTKIHLHDGDVILCDKGFNFFRDTIRASGVRFSLSRLDSNRGWWFIPLDSVVGLEYFDRKDRGARVLGSALLEVTTAGEIAVVSVFILKAIFGSCPTVYSFKEGREHLEAECFSYSIGRKFELADLDRLSLQYAESDRLTLRVKNEALETHYINEFSLCYVDHPAGTEVFPTDEGEFITFREAVSPSSAVNAEAKNILDAIRDRDSLPYKCDSAFVRRMFTEKQNDWIDCVVPVPRHASTMTVALRARNSLENTVLLYDVMMRNQGLNVLEWSEDINTDLWYAWKIARWYRQFSGIEILVYEDGEYVSKGRFFDTGPIAWRLTAAQVPLKDHGDSVKIRLTFLPDNWSIDWLGFGFDEYPSPPVVNVACVDARASSDVIADGALSAMRKDDDDYLVTYPGEWIDFSFAVPFRPDPESIDRTFFVRSKGYYVEWVRPEWVRERPDVPGFDVSHRDAIAQQLQQIWLAKKNRIEGDFFGSKIPSWNSGGRP